MTAPDLFAEAAGIVAERRRQCGPARPLFEQVARRWSATLGVEVTPEQVVLCMLDVKWRASRTTRRTATARSMWRATLHCWRN